MKYILIFFFSLSLISCTHTKKEMLEVKEKKYLVFWQQLKTFHHVRGSILSAKGRYHLYSESNHFFVTENEKILELAIYNEKDQFVEYAQFSLIEK